jgi:hypothetical protein
MPLLILLSYQRTSPMTPDHLGCSFDPFNMAMSCPEIPAFQALLLPFFYSLPYPLSLRKSQIIMPCCDKGMTGRVRSIELTEEDRQTLLKWKRNPSAPWKLVRRAGIVLAAAEGLNNS